MQPTIHIRDELVLEAYLDADEPHSMRSRHGPCVSQRGALPDQRAGHGGGRDGGGDCGG
jgi:hypothetical protein